MKRNMVLGSVCLCLVLAGAVFLTTCASDPAVDESGLPLNKASDFKISVFEREVSIEDYLGKSTEVNIPKKIRGMPVIRISVSAFEDKGLTSVKLPEGIITISWMAFRGNNLTEISIPSTVTEIGNFAFKDNQLTAVSFSKGLGSIGGEAFMDNQLTEVSFPDGLVSIGNGAFRGNQIATLALPDSITRIGGYAFADNKLTAVPDYNKWTMLGDGVFSGNGFSEALLYTDYQWTVQGTGDTQYITITGYTPVSPSSSEITIPGVIDGIPVQVIAKGAFRDKGLAKVWLSYNTKTIEDEAFADNLFELINLEGVEKIGRRAFYFEALDILLLAEGEIHTKNDITITISSDVELYEDSFNYFFVEGVYLPLKKVHGTYTLYGEDRAMAYGGERRWHNIGVEMRAMQEVLQAEIDRLNRK